MGPILRKLAGLAALASLALCGCKVGLYSGLDEKEATAMMATLMEQGVACEKAQAKEGWDLRVGKPDLPAAVRILAREGFPRHEYKDIGEVFGSKGLISSPQEDRIRYIFALSQEIAETISQIDGVLSSRVHLVLPENDPLSDSLRPSSASVFVKYLPSSPVRQNVTQIKQLVLNGVEGLAMDKVSVVTVPGVMTESVTVPSLHLMGMSVYKNSLIPFLGILGTMAPVLMGLGWFLSSLGRRRKDQGLGLLPVRRGKQPAGELASL